MKNTMKRFVSVVMAVTVLAAACFAFAGCGQQNDEGGQYFIGATGPLTGDAASYGIAVNRGAELAIKKINEEFGGLNGKTFKYQMIDDKALAADATIGYNTLFESGMQISIGSVTSGSCMSFAASAKEDNLFFMTPSASQQDVIETGKNAFRVCFGDPDQGYLAAEYLVKTKGFKDIGVIYDISDTYSSGIYDAFKAKMDEYGATFKVYTFDADNKVDFSTQTEALKDCDTIFIPIYYNEAALIAKAACGKGFDGLILGCDGLDGVAAYIDETVTVEINYITPFDVESDDENVKSFVESFKAAYNELPDQFAADGYDAVMAIYYAMKAAGVDDVNIDPSDLCDKVVAAITASDFNYKGLTGDMTWDTTGACTKVPVIVELGKK